MCSRMLVSPNFASWKSNARCSGIRDRVAGAALEDDGGGAWCGYDGFGAFAYGLYGGNFKSYSLTVDR